MVTKTMRLSSSDNNTVWLDKLFMRDRDGDFNSPCNGGADLGDLCDQPATRRHNIVPHFQIRSSPFLSLSSYKQWHRTYHCLSSLSFPLLFNIFVVSCEGYISNFKQSKTVCSSEFILYGWDEEGKGKYKN